MRRWLLYVNNFPFTPLVGPPTSSQVCVCVMAISRNTTLNHHFHVMAKHCMKHGFPIDRLIKCHFRVVNLISIKFVDSHVLQLDVLSRNIWSEMEWNACFCKRSNEPRTRRKTFSMSIYCYRRIPWTNILSEVKMLLSQIMENVHFHLDSYG